MPSIPELFTLEVPVSQLFSGCSDMELKALKMLLDAEMRRRQREKALRDYAECPHCAEQFDLDDVPEVCTHCGRGGNREPGGQDTGAPSHGII